MADVGHQLTDKELDELEARIYEVYKVANDDLAEVIADYFAHFEERDNKMLEMVKSGEITEEKYRQWRLAQMGRGQRFKALQQKIADRMLNANQTAVAYMNDATPGIYSLNYNYSAYTIEQANEGADFTLYDEQTVRRLLADNPELWPRPRIDIPADQLWNRQNVRNAVTAGILVGESIGKIATRLERVTDMNRNAAIRNARTAVTGAQNAGRQASYERAAEMGIQVRKKWVATIDNRTRHSHAALDGKIVAYNEKFRSILGSEMMYPGDREGKPADVYNCRCTVSTVEKDGIEAEPRMRRVRDPVTGRNEIVSYETYEEWAARKKSENPKEWEIYMKKGRNYSADLKQYNEYRAVLGNKIPNSFDGFQRLKYNTPEQWELTKKLKKQTVFVRTAPCVTTPRKFSGYFLKPGAKHADEFFGVGYSKENPMQLRYDIARQFDMAKAVNFRTKDDGAQMFNIFMELGVEKQRRFLTAWIIDTPESKPRIVTAFRNNGGKGGST